MCVCNVYIYRYVCMFVCMYVCMYACTYVEVNAPRGGTSGGDPSGGETPGTNLGIQVWLTRRPEMEVEWLQWWIPFRLNNIGMCRLRHGREEIS